VYNPNTRCLGLWTEGYLTRTKCHSERSPAFQQGKLRGVKNLPFEFRFFLPAIEERRGQAGGPIEIIGPQNDFLEGLRFVGSLYWQQTIGFV